MLPACPPTNTPRITPRGGERRRKLQVIHKEENVSRRNYILCFYALVRKQYSRSDPVPLALFLRARTLQIKHQELAPLASSIGWILGLETKSMGNKRLSSEHEGTRVHVSDDGLASANRRDYDSMHARIRKFARRGL